MIEMSDITIDEEFESLLNPLTADELSGLKESVKKDGFTDPIIVWLGRNILVDGHNRHRIWKEDLQSDPDNEPQIISQSFDSRDEVKEFILRRQLSRRNLNDAQRIRIVLLLKPVVAARAAENKRVGGKHSPKQDNLQTDYVVEPINTHREIGKMAGVGHDSVWKAEKVLKQADEETKTKMLSGEMTIGAAFKTVHVPQHKNTVEETQIEQKEPDKKSKPGVGLERAHEAIARLRSIPATDPLRVRAFDTVADWIKVNKSLPGGK